MNSLIKKISFCVLAFLLFLLSLFLVAESAFFIIHKDSYFKLSRLDQPHLFEPGLLAWEFSNSNDLSASDIALENSSFEEGGIKDFPLGWKLSKKAAVELGKGHSSASRAATLFKGAIFQETAAQGFDRQQPFILSAWIKTDVENNAYIQLEVDGDEERIYHSGNGRWQLISVLFDRNEDLGEEVKVILGVDKARAYFDAVKLAVGRKPNTLKDKTKRLRYRELINPRKQGRFRILTLGGSTTYCHGYLCETWPYILEHKLNIYYPGKFEVINLGVPGYSTRHILGHSLKSEDKDGYFSLNPDLVIIAPAWNDLLSDFTSHDDNLAAVIQYFRENLFVKKTALGYYVYKAVYSRLVSGLFKRLTEKFPQGYKLAEDADKETGEWLNLFKSGLSNMVPCLAFKARLKKIIELYRDNGVKTLLLTLPCIWLKDTDLVQARRIMNSYEMEEANYPLNVARACLLTEEIDRQVITSVARGTKSKCLDFTSYFREEYPTVASRADYFDDGTHFDLDGCNLLANYIYNSDVFQSLIKEHTGEY